MDFNKLLYNHNFNEKPQCGSLLIAEPLMKGDIFSRAVVMLLDADEKKGHLGLVLNKPLNISLSDLIPDISTDKSIPVFDGGPVDRSRLFMLHTLGDLFEGSSELIPGIYVGGKIEYIYEYLIDGGETEGKIRFFLGYSGWSAGQLRDEIDRNIWALGDASSSRPGRLLEGDGNDFWQYEVKELGDDFRSWLVVPSNPSLN